MDPCVPSRLISMSWPFVRFLPKPSTTDYQLLDWSSPFLLISISERRWFSFNGSNREHDARCIFMWLFSDGHDSPRAQMSSLVRKSIAVGNP
jgi:hypothetical protein